MSTVGIIANPAAGKDIRRLVAHGRFITNQEKINVIRRVLAGLEAAAVERVLIMPDLAMLGRAAMNGKSTSLYVRFLEMAVFSEERDSTRAAELMTEMGARCLITMGGDGTNRAVAKGSGSVPLVPIAIGTNNAFHTTVEGTVAGLAAGVLARGLIEIDSVTTATKILEVQTSDGLHDIALVDVAVCKQRFIGARAILDVGSVHEIYLARSEPGSIGLSAIGAGLRPSSSSDGSGLHIVIGPGGTSVLAPVAPGVVTRVQVQAWSPLEVGKSFEVDLQPCIIALDGERTLSLSLGQTALVELSDNGPPVVSVEETMRQASVAGIFASQLGGPE